MIAWHRHSFRVVAWGTSSLPRRRPGRGGAPAGFRGIGERREIHRPGRWPDQLDEAPVGASRPESGVPAAVPDVSLAYASSTSFGRCLSWKANTMRIAAIATAQIPPTVMIAANV